MRIGRPPGRRQRPWRDGQRVGVDDFEPARPMRADLGKRAERAASRSIAITFAAPSASSARVRPPGPGPDLDDRDARERPGGAGDLAR